MSTRAQNSGWVESTLSSLSIEEKVGQLFIADLIAVYSHKESPNARLAREFVHTYHVGGFVIAGGTVADIALTTNALQRESKIPLLFNGDLEGGLWFFHPYRRPRGRAPELPRFVHGGGTPFPSQMAIGATGSPRFAYEFGRITARESRAVGIHWTNSPVADVNNNPNNPIINTRSFGEDPALVATMVEAYVRGLQDSRMIGTLKHFPGHGDTEEDTHMKLPMLPFDLKRLESTEFVPFRAGIEAGVKAVMTAHIALPKIDSVKRPATLSPMIITTLLRGRLKFGGIVITDGMTMQGITDHFRAGDAAVRAIEAGADAILVPSDFDEAYHGVLSAVKSGRISTERMNESVRRILAAKAWVGLDKTRFVRTENISSEVASPESEAIADSIFSASVTVLRNRNKVLPLSKNSRVHIVTVTDEPNTEIGEGLAGVLESHVGSVTLSRLSNESGSEAVQRIAKSFGRSDIVVVGVYLSVGSWKGRLGFSKQVQEFLSRIQRMRKPVVTIAFGDPYILAKVPMTDVIITPYTGNRKAEEAVGRALVGATEVRGKLPVTIPGTFKRGDGIELKAARRPNK